MGRPLGTTFAIQSSEPSGPCLYRTLECKVLNIRSAAMAASLGIGAAIAPTASWAFVDTFTASGTIGGGSFSSSVTFTSSGSNLIISLTEKSATANAGQILDGLFFTISGANPVLGSAPRPSAIASNLFTSKSTSTGAATDITGGWLLKEPVNGFEYGLSAVGGGGLFPANQFTDGGGGDDVGIVGLNTNLALNTFSNKFALAEDTVTFTLTGLSNLATGIGSVEFAYNSALSESLSGRS